MDKSRFHFDGPVTAADHGSVGRLLTLAENGDESSLTTALANARSRDEGEECPVVGITGTGGAGKSSLWQLFRRMLTLSQSHLTKAGQSVSSNT